MKSKKENKKVNRTKNWFFEKTEKIGQRRVS